MGRIEVGSRGGPEVHVKRSARARRMSLRVSSVDGRVTLTLPGSATLGQARAFVDAQETWIARALAQLPQATTIEIGARLPLEGRMVEIAAAPLRCPRIDGDRLLAPERNTGVRVETFVKSLARDRITGQARELAGRIDAEMGRITLRDTRSRWGSCSSRGDLMFSWRLILAPPHVLRYVVAHEVAHLRHLDHSPRFWALVETLDPEHRAARRWLRDEGHRLHAYRFRRDRA